MEKLFRDRGLVERSGGVLLERGVSKLFHQFSFRKVFITIGILFLLGKYSRLLQSIDLFLHVVYFLLENYIL